MNEPSTSSPPHDGPVRWLKEWRTGSQVDFRIGRAGEDFIAEWAGLCTVRITRKGVVRRFTPSRGVDAERARRLLEGQVQGLVRHVTGHMSLHASAAARDDAAVVFLGPSASGKSTLVTDLCASGFAMLADDVAFLDEREGRFVVLPSERAHWLRGDASRLFGATREGPKSKVLPASVARDPVRLRLVVGLVFDGTLSTASLRRLEGHEAFRWLRTSLFRLVMDEPEVDASDFARVAALYDGAPLYELRRPCALEGLRTSSDLIRGALDGLGADGGTR